MIRTRRDEFLDPRTHLLRCAMDLPDASVPLGIDSAEPAVKPGAQRYQEQNTEDINHWVEMDAA